MLVLEHCCAQVLEVVRAGVSKVLTNRSAAPTHPVKRMIRMLTDKQAEAYLAAPAGPSRVFKGSSLDVELCQQQQMNSRGTSDEGLEDEDYFSGAQAQAEVQQQQLFGFLSSPRVRPVSVGPGGVTSSSGSVSDPGCQPSLSGSGGRTSARLFDDMECTGGGDVYTQQVRNAISNPGTAPDSLASSSADLHVHGISAAAGGKTAGHDAPSGGAVTCALQLPGTDSQAVSVI